MTMVAHQTGQQKHGSLTLMTSLSAETARLEPATPRLAVPVADAVLLAAETTGSLAEPATLDDN